MAGLLARVLVGDVAVTWCPGLTGFATAVTHKTKQIHYSYNPSLLLPRGVFVLFHCLVVALLFTVLESIKSRSPNKQNNDITFSSVELLYRRN